MGYKEKLKSPKWQRKRLQIMERDNFTCQMCMDTEKMLVVHHKKYIKGSEPWDYPDDYLITVCNTCHNNHHKTPRVVFTRVRKRLRIKPAKKPIATLFGEKEPTPLPKPKGLYMGIPPMSMQDIKNGLKYKAVPKPDKKYRIIKNISIKDSLAALRNKYDG